VLRGSSILLCTGLCCSVCWCAVSLDTSICTCTCTSTSTSTSRSLLLVLVNDAFLSLETDKNSFPLLQLTAVLMGHGHSPTNPALSPSLQHNSSSFYLYVYHRYGLQLLRLATAQFTTMLTQQSPAQGHQSYSRCTRIFPAIALFMMPPGYHYMYYIRATMLPQLFLLLAVTAYSC
jgi:hypothetical protein